MFILLFYSIIVMLASLVGVLALWSRAGAFIERNLGFLVSFSAGVILIIDYHLTREAIEHAPSPGVAIVWIGIGAVALWLLFTFLPAFHHHHSNDEDDDPRHHLDPRRLSVSDALHNIGDGILLATAFGASSMLGIATAVSVFVHELVQETSEFFIYLRSGYPVKKALIVNFIVAATILVGALGGYFLLETFEALEVPILGLAAGSFFMVVLHDLIPHSVRSSETPAHYLRHAAWFLAGLLVMLMLSTLLGHEEPHVVEHDTLAVHTMAE